MSWRGPASMILSAVFVLAAMSTNTFFVGGVVIHPFLGVMLAVCAWFAYWGVIGAVIGFAVPVFIGVPFLPALENVALAFLTVAVFVGQQRAQWIDIEARRMASVLDLTRVIIITVLVRELSIFAVFTVPALFRLPAAGPVLWNFVISFVELGVTTLVVVLPLLRMVTPVIKRVQRAEPGF